MTRILSVSSGRADTGILSPVWHALAARSDVELHILLTGMHMATTAAPVENLPSAAKVHRGGADLGGTTGASASRAMGEIAQAAGALIAATDPTAMLVIGDRLDMLPAATATLPFNLPLVHLHGGEVTEGAVDDRVRHALSKLAHLHCVSSDDARRRLLAMGEQDWRIAVTGAPGLDTLLAAPGIDAEEFAHEVGLGSADPFRLVTVHPETNAADPLAATDAVLAALAARPGPTLFTAPNSDPGGTEARRRIEAFCAADRRCRFVETLGLRRYAAALRHAGLMLGNSSSGIIEAGLFGLPAINVGNRQGGRLRGTNVIDIPASAGDVIAALDRLGPQPARHPAGTPYGDGASGPRVAAVLTGLPPRDRLLIKGDPLVPTHAHA